MLVSGSTPSFSEFDPRNVPYQARVIDDMNFSFNWTSGVHEVLLSGSIGSAKSLLAAHLGIKHALLYPNSRGCICRKAKPDLRDTIYTKICEHLEGTVLEDGTELKEGRHYFLKDTTCEVRFFNGSEIIGRSWADGNYKKLGSLELSWAVVEELTENDADDEMAIKYLRMRVGRLPHIPQAWIVYCTNPDSPSHFAYDYFDIGKRQIGMIQNLPPNRHVYFSKTTDNPFLPSSYIDQLKQNLDEKLSRRMIEGEWIEIDRDKVYYSYGEHNFKDEEYEVNPDLPVNISHDFNIGAGKPMSCCLSQYDPTTDTFHFFDEVIVEGADTEALMQEISSRGLLDFGATAYHIYGDASGASRSANSKKSNYDIIVEFLSSYRSIFSGRINFEKLVPKANPPVRERHLRVNAYCKNALGKTRLYVYKNAKTLHRGMRLTELKKGGQYIEDDSKPYQHVTTALGYHVHMVWKSKDTTSGLRMQKIR